MTDHYAFAAWDPLTAVAPDDPDIFVSAQRRQISNILKSYTGYYDVFSELCQNALDAIDRRKDEGGSFDPTIWIDIDLNEAQVHVQDNGCGMNFDHFKNFLAPNLSFKSGSFTRGSKGVGATYLGYGFNYLLVSTKTDGVTCSGLIRGGREWVEDKSNSVQKPKIHSISPTNERFDEIDRGTSITVKFVGENIRPKNLSWYQATTADQWMNLLRILTPIGGLYFGDSNAPKVTVKISIISNGEKIDESEICPPAYLYPHELISRSGSMIEFLKDEERRRKKGTDLKKIPPKFQKLNGLWGQWGIEEILIGPDAFCPINARINNEEIELARESGIFVYIYLSFSTDLWDTLNDKRLNLRKGARVLRGGLQLATRHMPQGPVLTIPMTNNIGFQNLAHVIVHFENAEPDLGRKGFQPEYVNLAEKIAVSAVTAFRRRYHLLRKPGGAEIYSDELAVEQWIRQQEDHEKDRALVISGKGLFMPSEELPIRSEPVVEQDVVALFNQMLSSGLVRGIQLIASSQYKQYDGLYRVNMEEPFDKFIYSESNPLGIDENFFEDRGTLRTKVKVLEYKFNVDGLVEELQAEVKNINDIGLVVAWSMGAKWKEMFDVTCLLDDELTHFRQIHGTTHSFTHSVSGVHAFEAIILSDLVSYLKDPESEIERQRMILESEE